MHTHIKHVPAPSSAPKVHLNLYVHNIHAKQTVGLQLKGKRLSVAPHLHLCLRLHLHLHMHMHMHVTCTFNYT